MIKIIKILINKREKLKHNYEKGTFNNLAIIFVKRLAHSYVVSLHSRILRKKISKIAVDSNYSPQKSPIQAKQKVGSRQIVICD